MLCAKPEPQSRSPLPTDRTRNKTDPMITNVGTVLIHLLRRIAFSPSSRAARRAARSGLIVVNWHRDGQRRCAGLEGAKGVGDWDFGRPASPQRGNNVAACW